MVAGATRTTPIAIASLLGPGLFLALGVAVDRQNVLLYRNVEVVGLESGRRQLDHVLTLGLIHVHWGLVRACKTGRSHIAVGDELIHLIPQAHHFLERVSSDE